MTGNSEGYNATLDPRTGRPPLPRDAEKLKNPASVSDGEPGADGLVHPDDGSPPHPPRMKAASQGNTEKLDDGSHHETGIPPERPIPRHQD